MLFRSRGSGCVSDDDTFEEDLIIENVSKCIRTVHGQGTGHMVLFVAEAAGRVSNGSHSG